MIIHFPHPVFSHTLCPSGTIPSRIHVSRNAAPLQGACAPRGLDKAVLRWCLASTASCQSPHRHSSLPKSCGITLGLQELEGFSCSQPLGTGVWESIKVPRMCEGKGRGCRTPMATACAWQGPRGHHLSQLSVPSPRHALTTVTVLHILYIHANKPSQNDHLFTNYFVQVSEFDFAFPRHFPQKRPSFPNKW